MRIPGQSKIASGDSQQNCITSAGENLILDQLHETISFCWRQSRRHWYVRLQMRCSALKNYDPCRQTYSLNKVMCYKDYG